VHREDRLKKLLSGVKRAVVKVGSAVITQEDKGLDQEVVEDLSKQIAWLRDKGIKVVLVSSGSIACGRAKLDYYKNPISLTEKQALAAVGQATLIQAYETSFRNYDIYVAQVLLTSEDLSLRERYLNAKKTLETLLKWDILPIVNENDTVTTEGIKFSDNDTLSALVAGTIEADIVFVLSDIDSLYDKDPRNNPDAKRIPEVEEIDEKVFKMAGKKPGRLGRGGMYSKLLAAKMSTSMGIPMVILPGKFKENILKFWQGEDIGTIFWAKPRKLPMRKLWIKYYIKPEAKLFLDKGAEEAILKHGKSLLIAGVVSVEGNFNRGACVECVNLEGKSIAKGLVSFSSEELLQAKLASKKTDREVIHRDNLVILEE